MRWFRKSKAALRFPLPWHEFVRFGLGTTVLVVMGVLWANGVAVAISGVVAAVAYVIHQFGELASKWKIAEKNLLLVSCTARFLLKGDASSLDELLQALIEGTTKNLSTDAVGGFFDCIDERIGPGSSYEEKRRVSEALPALFGIDTERAKKVARALRNDWDAGRWHADNRRRVIEAIRRVPELDHAFVEQVLRLAEGDDQYVALACAEVLNGLLSSWGGEHVDGLFNRLVEDMREYKFRAEDANSIKEVWNLIGLFADSGQPALQRCMDLIDSSSHLVQVSVARNIHRFSTRFPAEMLQLMEKCLQQGRHKNVRRPMARKSSMDGLKELLGKPLFRNAAQEMILRLVGDKDDIIATTAFDKVDTVFAADKETGQKMILAGMQSVIDVVRARAERAARRHPVTI